MLLTVIALHAVVGVVILCAARWLRAWGFVLGGLVLLLTVVVTAAAAGRVLDGDDVTFTADWVPQLGLELDLRLDAFALLMVVLVSGVGSLVFWYAWHYFGPTPRAARAAGLLTLFAGSMLGVVLADNLLMLFVFWELTTITSYLLIGLDHEHAEARGAALQALMVTGLGGLVMLGGLVLLGLEAGTFRLQDVLADPPGGTVVEVALVLVLVGAFSKSAQYPFHSWLPGAMVAPTPISAYLHSAAMVKAGVYLVARFAPAFADVGVWRPLVVGVGLVTMIAGGLRALRPFDLKQLLALGTVSQLGFLMVLFGIGQPEATAAGCALLLTHALFKAALFMIVGIVDHETGSRDIRAIPLLRHGWRLARGVAIVSAASMAAIPPLAGFIAKEKAYDALASGSNGDRWVLAGVVLGSVLTVAYSARFVAALTRPDMLLEAPVDRGVADHHPSRGFLFPGVVLATGSVVLGLVPVLWSPLIDEASRALDARSGAHLALWHGINAALLLSLFTLGAGAVLFVLRRRVGDLQGRLAPATTGDAIYDAGVRGMLATAGRTTSVVQSGSLPVYVAVIMGTTVLLVTTALLSGPWWSGWPVVVGKPAHFAVAGVLITGAVAATLATRRFATALLLGVVGYGMALLFVVQGAPDLALTQVAVETLSVMVFLLVLRRLPDRFERRAPAVRRVARIGISAAVGVFVVVMALAVSNARTAPPVSDAMSAQALPEGHGKNVVNVILVDIRGMDTMGEITVLVAAAIGIAALARAGRRRFTGTPDDPQPTSALGEPS